MLNFDNRFCNGSTCYPEKADPIEINLCFNRGLEKREDRVIILIYSIECLEYKLMVLSKSRSLII